MSAAPPAAKPTSVAHVLEEDDEFEEFPKDGACMHVRARWMLELAV